VAPDLLGASGAEPGSASRSPAGGADADVVIDSVGSLANAAKVVAQLHRGEKRLVFADSRSRVEQLAAELRRLGVATHVSHSSLSADARRQAEGAFAEGRDCVIVATSTLELGIDVGDLDRVVQVDATGTVASFLQRLGRTGRREGATRNCLFLATRPEALLQACALTRLWRQGYVEPVEPPPLPYHVFAQQVMALCLQLGGLPRGDWRDWIGGVPGFAALPAEGVAAVLDHLADTGILFDDGGVLWLGPEGEAAFGRRNFMELLSVFTSPPLFTVLAGREELGLVHQSTFQVRHEGPAVLLLGGRSWRVRHVDWTRRVAHVEAAPGLVGRSRWLGESRPLRHEACRSIQAVLAGADPAVRLSRRAEYHLADLREQFHWVDAESTVLLRERDGALSWWTFAGLLANWTLAAGLGADVAEPGRCDNLRVALVEGTSTEEVLGRIGALEAATLASSWDAKAAEGLKFRECLPASVAGALLRARLSAAATVAAVLDQRVACRTAA
jgi:ATP-dependent Lhr-like helicase